MLESLFNKETPTQTFSYEISKNFKNTYFEEDLWATASKKDISWVFNLKVCHLTTCGNCKGKYDVLYQPLGSCKKKMNIGNRLYHQIFRWLLCYSSRSGPRYFETFWGLDGVLLDTL